MRISVVIPTYNRRQALARCLDTLFEQDFPPIERELIVVVDGSRDGTGELLRPLCDRGELLVIEQENKGQTAALNTGVAAANGEIILFLDDDLLCDRALLSTHVAAHDKGEPMVVFGKMQPASSRPSSFAERWNSEALEKYYSRLDQNSRPVWPDDAWLGPNCSIRRDVFQAAGGYDSELFPRRGEDVDLGLRLWKMGVPFKFEPRAITSHSWVKFDRRLWDDFEEDGAISVAICGKHPEMRSRSWLTSVMTASGWKRYIAVVAASGRAGIMSLRVLVRIFERLTSVPWAATIGARLFLGGRTIAMLSGAHRHAGSWRQLKNLFGRRLAVLLYHHIGPCSSATKPLSLTITASQFRRHVHWLRWRGYETVTPTQWLAWCSNATPIPDKPILLTFDDAYADIANHALPLLEELGFTATIFVITGWTGRSTPWDGLQLLTMNGISDWSRRGFEIGAHTRTHPDLTTVSDDVAADEVIGSREDLRKAGVKALSFAYPYGCYDDRIRKAVDGVFSLAFTCEEGLNTLRTNPLILNRTMVQPGDTIFDLELRSELGWSPLNWIRSRLRLRTRFLLAWQRIWRLQRRCQ